MFCDGCGAADYSMSHSGQRSECIRSGFCCPPNRKRNTPRPTPHNCASYRERETDSAQSASSSDLVN